MVRPSLVAVDEMPPSTCLVAHCWPRYARIVVVDRRGGAISGRQATTGHEPWRQWAAVHRERHAGRRWRSGVGRRHLLSVRLEGIDCPESGQPFSQVARNYTRQLAFDQPVSVKVLDVDQYG